MIVMTGREVKKDLLAELNWLADYCLHHINQPTELKGLEIYQRKAKLLTYYNRLNEIVANYQTAKEGSQLIDNETISRIRRAKLVLMELDLDCETDMVVAKQASKGVLGKFTTPNNINITSKQLDPWDLTDDVTPMVEVISQPQTDKAMWQAALSYYGLPVAYSRFVKSMPIADSTEGKTKLVFTNVQDAAKDNRACWLQVNEPAKSYLAPKPNISHIVAYRNLTLDFEYPPNPYLCHAIGVELAQWLIDKGYAHEGLAVEDSGAGCHIVLPLVEIDVTKQVNGGGELLNKAVANVVDTYIKPQFEVIANRYGLSVGKAGDTRLEAYNIDRILSIPGTFRPANSKPNEATHLANGYMRKWLAPYDKQGVYPVRKESQVLHDLIMSTCLSVQNQQITTQQKVNELQQQKDMVSTNNDVTQVVHIDGGKRVNYQSWLEDYANRNPPTRSKAKGGGYARHAYFAKLVSATLKRFEVDGRSLALANASLIDDIAGRGDPDGAKFKSKAYQQVGRCLQTA